MDPQDKETTSLLLKQHLLELEKENFLLKIKIDTEKKRIMEERRIRHEADEEERSLKEKKRELAKKIIVAMKKGDDVTHLMQKARDLNKTTRLRKEEHKSSKKILEEKQNKILELKKKLEIKKAEKERRRNEKLEYLDKIKMKMAEYEEKIARHKEAAKELQNKIK